MAHSTKYWKSLRSLEDRKSVDSPEAHEFMDGVTDDFSPSEMSGMSRKQFLALLAASAAFTAAGCSSYRDKGEIVPYTKKPEEVTPGCSELLCFYMHRMLTGMRYSYQDTRGSSD